MKYLAVAGLAAVAAASPALDARDGWENVPKPADPSTWTQWTTPKPVAPTSTWNVWSSVKTPDASTTWATWGMDSKKADPTWEQWYKTPIYTTTVVTAITTYCPGPTKIVHAGKTYDITVATTLTITDCPCTVSVPVYTKTSSSCAVAPTPVKGDNANTWAGYPVAPSNKDNASTWAPYPLPTASTPVAPAGTAAWNTWADMSKTGPAIAKYTGAANKLNVGAGLAGIVGAAALLL